MIATTAALSHRPNTVRPLHPRPHIAHAITMGSNSFAVIWTSARAPFHSHWNHFPESRNAPQPHWPEVSDVTVVVGDTLPREDIILTPFHFFKKRTHHCKSDLTPPPPSVECDGVALTPRPRDQSSCVRKGDPVSQSGRHAADVQLKKAAPS